MTDVVIAIAGAVVAVILFAVIAIADRLGRDPGGRHHRRRPEAAGFADPAGAAGPDGGDWVARIRPDHLPRAGCLVTSELLEDPWDIAAQVRPPDPRPLSGLARGLTGTEVMPAASTGEMLAYGQVTPAEIADRLDRQHFGGEL